MKGSFNLSEWALKHQSFVWYLMFVALLMGVFSYFNLGREEDPSFTIKTMVIQTKWPGATQEETLKQVTDRIEKKLEELDSLDYVKSYTRPGESTVYVYLRDTTSAKDIPEIWYQVRKKINDIRGQFPQGIQGPGFNDEFGDVFGSVYAFTADGLTMRQLRDYVEQARAEIRNVPGLGKIEMVGQQDEVMYLNFSTRKLAALGIDQRQVVESLQSQNAVTPAGVIEAGPERISVRTSGQFASEKDLAEVNLKLNDRFYRLADIAEISRGYVDPATPEFRFDGKPAIGLAIAMQKGGNVQAFGKALHEAHRPIDRRPAGRRWHPHRVRSGRGGGRSRRRLHQRAVRSGDHRVGGELYQPRRARRSGGGVLDSAGAGDGLCLHGIQRHHHAADFPRCADHRPRPVGGRRDDHGGDDGHAPGNGRDQGAGGDLRLHLDRVPDAHRYAGDRRRFRADRPQRQLRW